MFLNHKIYIKIIKINLKKHKNIDKLICFIYNLLCKKGKRCVNPPDSRLAIGKKP